MSAILSVATLPRLPAEVQRPDYDVGRLGVGLLHLGVGAFHRAHQALYTEEAMGAAGGDWGIIAAAFRHAAVPEALRAQDHLYTVETLSDAPQYRVTAAIRSSLTATRQAAELRARFVDPKIRLVTLTVTEKGYCLDPHGELDVLHADIAHDLEHPAQPLSAIGWLALGLAERCRAAGTPLTVISCDNLKDNGLKLGRAVSAFMERVNPEVLSWLREVTFPQSVVDCIVPASNDASRARVAERLGANDAAAVQREPYSQWVIEDRFAGPRPAWERVGVQLVADVADYARLKLHVLNAAHSALAYLGLPRGYALVREAVADRELAGFLNELIEREIRPALAPLAVDRYWSLVRGRFQNPHIDHRLAQIAEDGGLKLSQRVFPLMIANQAQGAPITDLARIVRAWLDFKGLDVSTALDDASLFPAALGANPSVRSAIISALP